MQAKKIIGIFVSLNICAVISAQASEPNYLAAPTGKYSVGFHDFHWINQDVCPDPNFNGDASDFSEGNTKFCHEIVARTYYPTAKREEVGVNYYAPFVNQQKKLLRFIPGVKDFEIEQLTSLKTYTFKDAPIVESEKFPVLIFVPGFTFPAQIYENAITELVSHGYIVVGMNTPFMNTLELPNGHVIEASMMSQTPASIEQNLIPLQMKDVGYVFKQIHVQHETNSIFAAMDLNHVGALGHSVGARVIADISHEHKDWFQAGATLDIGFDTTGNSTKMFAFPFLHQIAANRMSDYQMWPIKFELGYQNYLIGMAPTDENHSYSKHMNFSDLSSLQYMPVYKKALPYLAKHAGLDMVGDGDGYDINTAINTYLLKFFDMYLKGIENQEFKKCMATVTNTYISCG